MIYETKPITTDLDQIDNGFTLHSNKAGSALNQNSNSRDGKSFPESMLKNIALALVSTLVALLADGLSPRKQSLNRKSAVRRRLHGC